MKQDDTEGRQGGRSAAPGYTDDRTEFWRPGSFGLRLVLMLMLSLGTASFLSAQQVDSARPAPTHYMILDQVVISAGKTEEMIRKVPQQVVRIPEKEIRSFSPPSTADLLMLTAGIPVQKSQQGGGSPNLRGFEANKVLLILDGIRMNNLIYRKGHLQNIITTDPSVLSSVEVLYGPSSTLYGSDALGGTIVMLTADPETAPQKELRLTELQSSLSFATANEEKKLHLHFNLGNQRFASLSSFTHSDFGDLRMGKQKNPFYRKADFSRDTYVDSFDEKDSLVRNDNPLVQKFSAYRQTDLMQKFLYRVSEDEKHLLNLQLSNSSDIPRYDRLTDPDGAGLKFAEWYYGPQLRMLGAYELKLKNRMGLNRIDLSTAAQYIEESRHNRRFNKSELTHRSEYVNVYSLNLDLQKVNRRHDFRFGLESRYQTLKSRGRIEDILSDVSGPLDTRYPDGINRMAEVEVYLSHRFDINEKLWYQQGLRAGFASLYCTFKDTTFFNFPFREIQQQHLPWSFNAGLSFVPGSRDKFSVSLSSAYRVPNVDDAGKVFEKAPGTIIIPNASLKPEQAINLDLGYTRLLTPSLAWETVIYGTWFHQIIAEAPSTYQGSDSIMFEGTRCQVITSVNHDKAYLAGINTQLKGALSLPWSVHMSVHYTYGRIISGDSTIPLAAVFPVSAKAGLTFEKKSFSAGFYILFHGWKRLKDYAPGGEDNLQYATADGMPAWYTLNLRGSYQLNHSLGIQLGLENILDTQYRVFSSGINATGRNLSFRVNLRI
ncbi:MAG TPA: TonB-dependent receptor [Bacteroidales bacterium]|nr:TonB-dependent receptor [Bacteroidales bacterium]HSA42778.1 TonB-dependent receptor [Bacteroidales bacterium]